MPTCCGDALPVVRSVGFFRRVFHPSDTVPVQVCEQSRQGLLFHSFFYEEGMTKQENPSRRSDVLAIGLFGLAVGALTVGMAQVG